MRHFSTPVIVLFFLGAALVMTRNVGLAQERGPQHTVPVKSFPRDQRFETVSGDPKQAGALYVIRIHAEAGYIVMPHTHPEDEHIVVVQGSWALGMGDRFDRQALEPMELGTYGLVPKKMAHYGLSKTETIVQVHGIGPFTTTWLVPIYERNDRGTFLGTSAAEVGRPVPTSPADCFALRLGARVGAKYGDGVVIAAQCTPGQLTQYRVEMASGERYWAQRDELNVR